MRYLTLLIVVLGLFVPAGLMPAQEDKQDQDTVTKAEADKAQEKKTDEKKEELTLERLFPEKSFFGPSARSTDFSFDGHYCAYLYRPYIERRHGSDLWIYDVQTGEARRITSVSVMSRFQEATREVRDDRVKKAKKRETGKKEQDKGEEKGGQEKAEAAPSVDDGVSGDWEGILTDGESLDLPPDGLKFDLSIAVDEEGAVTGTLRTPMNSATITDGKFDKATGSLTCTLTDSESGMTAALSATVKDQAMTGTITIAAELLNVTLRLSAERTAALQQQDDEQEQEEQELEKQQEEVEEAEKQGGEGEVVEKTDDAEKQKDKEKEKDLGDVVDDKDADDEKAPRYGGVSTYVWAPETCELIFTSGGDLYRYDVEKNEITRLTMTQESERGVQYLPDGSGYTFMRGRSVMKVTFGSSLLEQIDPKLPGGEEFSGYRMSPDGKVIAFLTSKGDNSWEAGRQVNIINYRNRFAEVRQVNRHMSDDPRPKIERTVYTYDMRDHFEERGVLSKLFTATQNMPRDFVGVPEWSLDSSRVTFSAFDQATGQVKIFEAVLPEEKAADGDKDGENGEPDKVAGADEKGEDNDGEENGKNGKADDGSSDEKKRKEVPEAAIVYQFFHNGGPSTPPMIQPAYLADNRRIVFITELSGFRQLHVLDPVYEQLDQLTRGRFEVYPERLSKDHTLMFATSTMVDPAQLDIYRIDLNDGEMTRLDNRDGTYSTVAVSNDGKHALANFVDYGTLPELVAIDADAAEPRVLTDSHPKEARELTKPIPEFFTYENRHGQEIHGCMFKPDDWTPQDKRPLLIYVYGGPLGTRKMVTRGSFSSDGYFFAYYMAKKHGYVTCTIDPRGASGYGGLFEKSNYEQVGKPQVEDLVDGAKWFIANQGVDPKRVGIHGWSFGGFQTQMCLYTEPDVFACGMAGAGPTEWENYNSWYSMATIGPSREGKTDLEKFSLLPLAKNLKAKLLLVHGMEDSNVLYQDTVRVYRELLKAGKEALVELFLDPTGGHGLGGDVKRINRFRKYEEFLIRNLGEGKPAVVEGDEAGTEAKTESKIEAGEAAEKAEDSTGDKDKTDDQDKKDINHETDDDGLALAA